MLNGTWAFGMQAAGCDPLTVPYNSVSTPNTTSVPGSFDIAPPGILGPRIPCAFYRSTHTCTPGAPAVLKFYAVNFFARVFVDGVEMGKNFQGGYSPFELLAPACASAGTRELAVVVANTQNYTLTPTFTGGDFFFYSGIIRPVIVTELSPTSGGSYAPYWLDRLEPIPKDAQAGLFDVRVVLAGDMSATKGSVHLSYMLNGGAWSTAVPVPVVNGTATLANLVAPPSPRTGVYSPWQLGQDNSVQTGTGALFTVGVQESFCNDAIETRTAIRVLGTLTDHSGTPLYTRLTLNGQVVKLLGFNRHTMWPDTGAAVTQAQEAIDMSLIKAINANYVRGAHYPQSQSWLDLCDEQGVAMWEETLGPGTSTANMNDPWFMTNHLSAVASMVAHSFAHPSVIFHAFFNEGPSDDPAACVGYARSSQTIRESVTGPGFPPVRYVTWANNHGPSDVCIDYEDVISFNGYPGWYDHEGNVTYPAVFWGGEANWAATTWPLKPLTISETGGGGVWEWSNDTAPFPGPQWSQFFQTNLVTADASFLAIADHVSGLTLWQFADIKANDQSTAQCGQCVYYPHPAWPADGPAALSTPWNCSFIDVSCGRPGGENHKGAVDFWRRQKEEFAPLAQIYGKYATGAGNE